MNDAVRQHRIASCVRLLEGVPTEILDAILLASSRNVHNSPASDICEHIRRWHELNGQVWDGNEQSLKDNPPTWNGKHWVGPNGIIFPQAPSPWDAQDLTRQSSPA